MNLVRTCTPSLHLGDAHLELPIRYDSFLNLHGRKTMLTGIQGRVVAE